MLRKFRRPNRPIGTIGPGLPRRNLTPKTTAFHQDRGLYVEIKCQKVVHVGPITKPHNFSITAFPHKGKTSAFPFYSSSHDETTSYGVLLLVEDERRDDDDDDERTILAAVAITVLRGDGRRRRRRCPAVVFGGRGAQ
jgi:hypothetical protein